MGQLQKTHVWEIQPYVSWKRKHCKEDHYSLQIKKCLDPNCCTPTNLSQEELKWLSMPILDSSGFHYLPYDEANLLKKEAERNRPKQIKQPKNAKNALPSSTTVEKGSLDLTLPIPVTAQNARAVVYCVEYENPRVIYSKNKLNHN